jgi:hypothetical protein
MNNNSAKLKKDWLASLPAETREFLTSEELSDILMQIKTDYGLFEKQTKNKIAPSRKASNLSLVLFRILRGEIPQKNLEQSLQKELNIDEKRAKQIAQALEQQIISRVQKDLNKFYSPEKEEKFKKIAKPKRLKKTDAYLEPIE